MQSSGAPRSATRRRRGCPRASPPRSAMPSATAASRTDAALARERRLAADHLEARDAEPREARQRAQAAGAERVAAARLAAAVVRASTSRTRSARRGGRALPPTRSSMQYGPNACVVAQMPSSNTQPSFSRKASHSSPGIAVSSISASVTCRGRITRATPRLAVERRGAGIAAAREARDVHARREPCLAQREQQFPLGDDERGDADVVDAASGRTRPGAARRPPGYDGALSVANTGRGAGQRHDPAQVVESRHAGGFRVAAVDRRRAERLLPAGRGQAAVELVRARVARAAAPRRSCGAARGSSRRRLCVHDDPIGRAAATRAPLARDLVEQRVPAAPVRQRACPARCTGSGLPRHGAGQGSASALAKPPPSG